jgi:hypothetical protein
VIWGIGIWGDRGYMDMVDMWYVEYVVLRRSYVVVLLLLIVVVEC